MDHDLPTEEDLLAGRMPDGSRVPLRSKELYGSWADPQPVEKAAKKSIGTKGKSLQEIVADDLHHQIDMQLLADLEIVIDVGRTMCAYRHEVGQEENNSPGGNARGQDNSPGGNARGSGEQAPDNDSPGSPVRKNGASGEQAPDNEHEPSNAEPSEPRGRDDRGRCSQDGCAPSRPSRAYENVTDYGREYTPKQVSKRRPDGTIERKADESDRDYGDRLMEVAMEETAHALERDNSPGGNARGSGSQARGNDQGGQGGQAPFRKAKREPDPARNTKLTDVQKLSVAERGAKLLTRAALFRAEVAHRMADRVALYDKKTEFIHDRAHAVVINLLGYMDKAFTEVGFGSWMPFRFPDQWLMFCGVMRRVLAANGLIHSEHAEIYRRLLEETPPVEDPPGMENLWDRVHRWKPPQSWGLCHANRGVYSLDELRQRLAEKNKPRGPDPPE